MSVDYNVRDFPALSISEQLFHVPGMAVEGGFTSGGVRVTSPEPGGRAFLEIKLGMQTEEWINPFASWLMSQINGQIFRVRLARTPQVLTSRSMIPSLPLAEQNLYNQPLVVNDLVSRYTQISLIGSTIVKVDMSEIGPVARNGHVLGHADNCYLIDDITYDEDLIATIIVTPPLRRSIAVNDEALFRPFFTGTIANGSEIRASYDASNAGNIQLQSITFSEVILS